MNFTLYAKRKPDENTMQLNMNKDQFLQHYSMFYLIPINSCFSYEISNKICRTIKINQHVNIIPYNKE